MPGGPGSPAGPGTPVNPGLARVASVNPQSGQLPSGPELVYDVAPQSQQYLTQLAANVGVGDQQIQVTSMPPQGLVGGVFRILVDNEWMLAYPQAGATTWPVARGIEGSTPAAHASGANVFHVLTTGAVAALLSQVLAAAAAQPVSTAQLPNAVVNGTTGAVSGRKLMVLGASHAEPYGPKHGFTWPFKVAREIGAEEINYAWAGSVLSLSDNGAQVPLNSGGYASVLNAVIPTMPQNVPAPVGIAQRQMRNGVIVTNPAYLTTGAYVSAADIYVSTHGGDDIFWAASTTKGACVVLQGAMEMEITRARAGAVFNDDDSLITYGGTWVASPWGTANSASTKGSLHSTTTAGSTVVFSVPASYDGGEIAFYFLAGFTSGPVGTGGLITFTASTTISFPDGQNTLDLSNSTVQRAALPGSHSTLSATGAVKRMKLPVTGQVQTITATVTSFSGVVPTNNSGGTVAITQAAFDSVTIEATQPPRYVQITLAHAATSVTVAGAPNPGPFTNNDVDTVNAAYKSMRDHPVYWGGGGASGNGFGDNNVLIADWEAFCSALQTFGKTYDSLTYGSPHSFLWSDNFHINEYGQDILSQLIVATLANGPSPIVNAASAAPTWRQVGINTVVGSAPASQGSFTLASGLTSGTPVSSLTATAVQTIPAGAVVTLVLGSAIQSFTVASAVSASTTIPVLTETPYFSFTTGSTVTWQGPNSQYGAEPAYGTNWSSGTTGTAGSPGQIFGAEFCKDSAGCVHLRGYVKNGSTPSAGAVIFQLPTYCRPAENSGAILVPTQAGTGIIQIDTMGNVIYESGTVTNWMSLANISFIADGGSNPPSQ